MTIHAAGVQYMRLEIIQRDLLKACNTEHSWLAYLHNMSVEGTWADALVIQAVADARNISLLI